MSGGKRVLYILATGIVVIIAVSVVLFWARFIPAALFFNSFHPEVGMRPSGLLSEEEELKAERYSSSLIAISHFMPNLGLGKELRRYDELNRYELQGRIDFIEYGGGSGVGGVSVISYTKFNRRYGLLEQGSGHEVNRNGKTWYVKDKTGYMGPKGASTKPEVSLGRFYDLIGTEFYQDRNGLLIYDKVLRRFFRITYKMEKVKPTYKVTVIVKESNEMSMDFEPVQMGNIQKNSQQLQLSWNPSRRKGDPNNVYKRGRRDHSVMFPNEDPNDFYPTYGEAGLRSGSWDGKVIVLGNSSALSIVDVNTLTIKNVGYQAQSKYEASPYSSLAYTTQPFVRDEQFSGLVTASLARDGMSLWMTVFDANGNQVRYAQPGEYTVLARDGWVESRQEAKIYHELMVCSGYVAESLAPPVFGIGSFFAAPHIEAGAGYRAMFLLPNSVTGTWGAVSVFDPKMGIIFGLLALAPSVLFGLFLGWRIRVNARLLGVGTREQMWWTVGAIAFGLCAYITYRFTRPKVTLVTCANCGKLRRPDMESCHRCGAAWHIPEIEPPLWRVVEDVKNKNAQCKTEESVKG